jgi:hypothetical protein
VSAGRDASAWISRRSAAYSSQRLDYKRWAVTSYLGNWNAWTHGHVANEIPDSMPVNTGDLTDGASHTLMLAEGFGFCDRWPRVILFNGTWTKPGTTTPHPMWNLGLDWAKTPNTYMFQMQTGDKECSNWRAQSAHEHGLNIALADGSVHTISNKISHKELFPLSGADFGTEFGVGPLFNTDPFTGAFLDPNGVWDKLMLPRDGEPSEFP